MAETRRARLLVTALLLGACSYRTEHGLQVADTVAVIETSHEPSHSVTTVGPSFGKNGGVAVGFGTTPASYVVVYRWRGEKVVRDDRALWEAVAVGDSVVVRWHPRFHVDKKTGARTRVSDAVDGVQPLRGVHVQR